MIFGYTPLQVALALIVITVTCVALNEAYRLIKRLRGL